MVSSVLFDRSFGVSLLVSVTCHSILFWQLPSLEMLPSQKALNPMEVTYYSIKETVDRPPVEKQPLIVVKAPPPVTQMEKTEIKNTPEKPEPKEEVSAKEKIPVEEKTTLQEKVDTPTIPPSLPKEDEPLYLDYYGVIRERIRRFATRNYRYHSETGDIHCFFVLTSNGLLREVNILDKQSRGNGFLKEVALRSIKGASPFPRFPSGLDQPQLSFNVVISFERVE